MQSEQSTLQSSLERTQQRTEEKIAMIHTVSINSINDEEVQLEATEPQVVVSSGAPPKKPPSRRRKKAQSQTPPTKDMIPLDPGFQPGKLDVICSRGKFAYNSPGYVWMGLSESLPTCLSASAIPFVASEELQLTFSLALLLDPQKLLV